MNIAVIGACADMVRQIAQQIVAERLLNHNERLVLVGNADGASARSAYGLAADLTDAYSEICPAIEVVLDPADIRADLIVAAAGVTPKPALVTATMSCDGLAEANVKIFHRRARAIAKNGHGHQIVICIANPVELGLAVFAQHLGRQRVMGMGSFLDSLRFRQEIAVSLGIRRQCIHAFVAGEHGSMAVPLWSDVHVYGYFEEQLSAALRGIRKGVRAENLWDTVTQAQAELASFIRDGKVHESYAVSEKYPPDVCVVTPPFVTHYSGTKTVIGTARATMEFIRTITQGADVLVSGQVALEGEAHGIHGSIGLPFVVGNRGVDRVFGMPIDDVERKLLYETAGHILERTKQHL